MSEDVKRPTSVFAHLYDPDSAGGGVGDHMLVRVRLSLFTILSELGIEGLVLILFDLHRARSKRTRDGRGLELPKADELVIASREFLVHVIRDKSEIWDWLDGSCRRSVNITERVFQGFFALGLDLQLVPLPSP